MQTFGDAFAEGMLHRGSEPISELPMPVTAKLSKAFYDKLGEQVVGEMVTWFNDVYATSRADLKEFNELNFARFDAKLEQRVAEIHAKLDQRFAQLDAKIDQQIARLDAKIDQQIARLDATIDLVEERLNNRMTAEVGALRELMERRLREQDRWTFGLYAGMIALFVTILLRT